MRIFVISDLHFGHKKLLRLERSEFETIEEHDQTLIDNINKMVKPTDLLYVLGDVGNIEKCRLLNGRKIMIMGNHDARPKREYKMVFSEVYETPIFIKENIVFSHYPIPVTAGTLNVHGHLHGSRMASENYMNLSAHLVNMKPVNINVIFQKASELPKDSSRFLHEWYADQYVFTTERDDVIVDENGRVKLQESLEFREKLYAGEKK